MYCINQLIYIKSINYFIVKRILKIYTMEYLRKNILVVEDEPAHAEAIKRSLENRGAINLTIVQTLKEYEDWVSKHQPDIVLMDMKLPDGEALTIMNKPLNQQLFPVVMMTSFGDEQKAVNALRAGFIDYIVKSAETFADIPRTIERAFREWGYIQEQKRTEQALKESEERWHRISESTFEGIGFVVNGKILDLNIQLAKMLGYAHEEMIGQSVMDFVAPRSKNLVFEKIKSRNLDVYEHFAIRKDGSEFPVEVRFGEIQYKGQHARVSVIRDITERKKTEEELRKAKEKAEESDNLKSVFLQNLSHEIRTPMNGIIGFSEFLKSPDLSYEQQIAYVDIIHSCSKQLLNSINDIIEISKIESGYIIIEDVLFDLNNLLNTLFNNFQSQAKEQNLQFNAYKSINDKSAEVHSDQLRIQQILECLLTNAFKFTPTGSIDFGYTIDSDMIRFFVKDTGMGIPSEHHESIFTRFSQVDTSSTRTAGGLGLGLSIARTYIEKMGGKIWLNSSTNDGTTFYFTIPYKPNKQYAETSKIPLAEIQPDWSDKTILIVDDDLTNYLLLKTYFLKTKANILYAANGKEAINLCDSNLQISLILMDMKMPVMDGFECTPIIKAKYPHIPVIAQTAYAFPEEQERAMQSNCDDFFTKPIKRKELIELLSRKYLGV